MSANRHAEGSGDQGECWLCGGSGMVDGDDGDDGNTEDDGNGDDGNTEDGGDGATGTDTGGAFIQEPDGGSSLPIRGRN